MIRYEDIPRSFNLASWFLDRNVVEGNGDRIALCYRDRAITYAELVVLTNRIGQVLIGLGVRPQDRVLLALSDGPEFVATWYATLKIGAVVAEVYTFLQPKDYAYFIRYTRARVVVVDETTLGKVRQALMGERFSPLVLASGAADLGKGEASLEQLIDGASDVLEPADTTKDDIAIWKFTSGSTGLPRAAVHRAYDPLVSFECYARGVVGYEPRDVVLPVPKLFFGYARDATALFPFGVGAAGIVFPERTTPARIFELIEQYRPTILVQVPTMMSAMLVHPDAGKHDLSSLRLCLSSGERLPIEVHQRWLDTFGVEVLEGIGSSELYHIYLSNRPGHARVGSVGQEVPGYRARLVDEAGGDVSYGTPGELWVEGDSTALFYWGDHEKSKRTFIGNAVRTGDIFERDVDGYFWYRGRADDLLKVGGIWVAPREIEECLLQHSKVLECAVVGYEEDGLTLPRAFVVAPEGGASDCFARQLQDFVRSELSPHKYPREVRFVRELPKTASGKIDRRALLSWGPTTTVLD